MRSLEQRVEGAAGRTQAPFDLVDIAWEYPD